MIIKPGKLKSLLPYFLFAVAIIGAYKVITEISFFINGITQLWGIITPFFYGFLLAYILNLPFSGLNRLFGKIKFIRRIKKPLSIIITYLLFILALLLIIYLLIPYIFQTVSFFITNFPSYYERTLQLIDYVNNLKLLGIYISTDGILAMLHEAIQNLNIENLSSSINTVFGGLTSAIFTSVLAFISSIYVLIEKEKIKEFFNRLLNVFLPARISNATIEYAKKLNNNFRQYIFTQTIDGLILGSIVTIQLLIMGSPFAFILGLMLGIINYIPYFGSIFGSIIAIIVVTFTQGLTMGAIAAVVILITQQIDGNVIQPKLMGGSFSLSPFLVIVSISIGGAAAGVLGMIAAIPIVAVLKDMLESIMAHCERKKSEPLEPPSCE